MRKLIILLLTLTFAIPMATSCREEKSPGEKIEEGIKDVGEGIKDGTKKVKKDVKETTNKLENKAEELVKDD